MIPPELRPHVVTAAHAGALDAETTCRDLDEIFAQLDARARSGAIRHVLLYAHGGLVTRSAALDAMRGIVKSMGDDVHVIGFVWHSGLLETLVDRIEDKLRGHDLMDAQVGPIQGAQQRFLDPEVEKAARVVAAPLWNEMKRNAQDAWKPRHAGDEVLVRLADFAARHPDVGIHVAGHSAGSIYLGPFVKRWIEEKRSLRTCSLWAPACTTAFFRETYGPALAGGVGAFRLYTLTDDAETSDTCDRVYAKSLLYLVSRALEEGTQPVPLLGMQTSYPDVEDLLAGHARILAPQPGPWAPSNAARHGDFDNDPATLVSTAEAIHGKRLPVIEAEQPLTRRAER